MLDLFRTALQGAYAASVKRSLDTFIALETGVDNTFIANDGSLATVVKIDGMRQIVDDEALTALVLSLQTKLAAYFTRQGHALQVWFMRDPDLSDAVVDSLLHPPSVVAKRLGLALEDLLEERRKLLPNHIVQEGLYVTLWTRPSILTEVERKQAIEEGKPPPLWPMARDSQYLFGASRKLFVRHEAMIANFLVDLRESGLRATALDVVDALFAIRGSLFPEMWISAWEPLMPGVTPAGYGIGKARVPWPRLPKPGEMSHLLWPRISSQLLTRDARVLNQSLVRVGEHVFGAVDMTVGPQELLPFRMLLRRIREMREFPWRVSFLIEGGGLQGLGMKSFLAAITGFSNSENRLIREAIKLLKEHSLQGGVVVRLRASFCTWGPADRVQLVEERLSRLQRSVESWGYCQASSTSGDPVAAIMSSALGVDAASTAVAGAAPLEDALFLLPWDRDASPFETGSVLFRTEDGRAWPYTPGSTQEDTSIDIIYAPPGKGKSVFLNTVSLAFCLSPQATFGTGGAQLPRIAIIDIGPSSSGLISLIKEALPPDRRHEAEYRRLRMTRDSSINPFDTQLGCRGPLFLDRSFLVNFLTLLGSESNRATPPAGLSDLVGMVIDEAYARFSDVGRSGQPRPYAEGEDENVDRAIRDHGLALPDGATWWWLVDRLFEKGDIRRASLAQRHAVPRIEDLPAIANSSKVLDLFGQTPTESGEMLIPMFQRMISSALREYPILSQPTRFDLGDARVVSLDLNDVAPKGGGPAAKQTALMYMLGRFVLARDFYLNPDDIDLMPALYREWHRLRIQRIRETPKRLVMDEFHRTEGIRIIRDQVRIDMREGRKWGVQIALASQLLGDFDQDMLSLATGYWIMGVANEQDRETAAGVFGLSSAAKLALRQLTGPRKGGAPFLALLQLKDGKHEHLLFNTLGPVEIWAFSTTPDDVALRKRLYEALGPVEARRRLAKRFPNGTAREYIERMQARMVAQGMGSMQEISEGVVAKLAQEMIDADG
jgi:intracellular multiplication protein IcmB